MFVTWLGLIALQTLVTEGSSSRLGKLFSDLDSVLERALDPTVPAIPDLRSSTPAPSTPAPSVPTTGLPEPADPPRLRIPQSA